MNTILIIHSVLRFFVLGFGFLTVAISLRGLTTKAPYTRPARIIGAAFTGLLHTQATLGIIMVALGRTYPALIGHIVVMLSAAVVAQILMSRNRRLPVPGHRLPLMAASIAIVLICVGIAAIQRHPLQITVF